MNVSFYMIDRSGDRRGARSEPPPAADRAPPVAVRARARDEDEQGDAVEYRERPRQPDRGDAGWARRRPAGARSPSCSRSRRSARSGSFARPARGRPSAAACPSGRSTSSRRTESTRIAELSLPAREARELDAEPEGSRAHVYVVEGKLDGRPGGAHHRAGSPATTLRSPTDVPHLYRGRAAGRARACWSRPSEFANSSRDSSMKAATAGGWRRPWRQASVMSRVSSGSVSATTTTSAPATFGVGARQDRDPHAAGHEPPDPAALVGLEHHLGVEVGVAGGEVRAARGGRAPSR